MKLVSTFAALALVVSACGGGGSDSVPAVINPPNCTPTVAVNLYGDSTMLGIIVRPDGTYYTSTTNAPDIVLRELLDRRFGAGKVVVTNYGVGGEILATFLSRGKPMEGISLSNYGINDRGMNDLPAFEANLRKISPTFYVTPNPLNAHLDWWVGDEPKTYESYVQAVRAAGAERNIPVIDVYTWLLSQADWRLQLDAAGIHPSEALYRRLTTELYYPAIEQQVVKRLCVV